MTKKSEVLLEAIVRGADDRLATDIVAFRRCQHNTNG